MSRPKLLYAAVVLMQFGGSTGVTGIALLAQWHFDCPFWALTFIGTAGPLAYAVSCLALSNTLGKVKPFSSMFAGIALFGASFVLALWVRSPWHLIFVGALQAATGALFWPMLEILLAEGSSGSALSRRMGFFNICWSSADAVGAALAGILYKIWIFAPFVAVPITMAAVAVLTLFASRRPPEPASNGKASPVSNGATSAQTLQWRKAAWLSNFVGFGVTNVIRSVFAAPALKTFHMSEPAYGFAVATFNALRTLTFVVLGRWSRWHYRPRAFFAVNSLLAFGMGGAFAAAFLPPQFSVPLVFFSFAGAGVGIGMTYTSSIFYSLNTADTSDVKAHFHEAVLGGGGALFTLASGLANAVSGSILSPLPLCVVAVILGMGVSARFTRAARQAGKPLEDSPRSGYPQ